MEQNMTPKQRKAKIEYNRQYKKDHPEMVSATRRQYYEKHRDREIERSKQWRADHPEQANINFKARAKRLKLKMFGFQLPQAWCDKFDADAKNLGLTRVAFLKGLYECWEEYKQGCWKGWNARLLTK
jgi:hypothetical protein